MRIKIPFCERFIMDIAANRKTMTTRSRRCGKMGDIFYPRRSLRCVLLGVGRKPLKEIAKKFYRQEGFKSPDEFKKFWLTIHRKWQPDKKFYLHTFIRDSKWEFSKWIKGKR